MCESFFGFSRKSGVLYDGKTRIYRQDGSPVAMFSMGGLAEFSVVPATAAFPLPPALQADPAFTQSAIVGCAVLTAYGALRHTADMRAGDSVAVIGCGGVGANCVQVARAFGADNVIAVDINADKLSMMERLGATSTVNAKTENVAERIKQLTGGRGVDVAVEALGNPQTFSHCINSVCDGGKVVMIGLGPQSVQIEITKLVRRQIKILGSYGGRTRQDVPAILRLVQAGKLDLAAAISDKFVGLEQANTAYQALELGQIKGRAVIQMF